MVNNADRQNPSTGDPKQEELPRSTTQNGEGHPLLRPFCGCCPAVEAPRSLETISPATPPTHPHILPKGLNEQQKLIISVTAVVAVLVANVSFLGYVVPPGGTHPYWENCEYKSYFAFLIFNGLAFLFSLRATAVVLVVPWLYKNDEDPVDRWIGAGLILLVVSIAFFTVAFFLSGLVTGGYAGEDPNCGVLHCENGGVACRPSIQDGSMAPLLSLNNVYGECFFVSGIERGSSIRTQFPDPLLLYKNSSETGGLREDGTNVTFDTSGCYLVVQRLNSSDIGRYASRSNKVLCTAGPLVDSGNNDMQAAGKVNLQDALVDMTDSLWIAENFFIFSITMPPGNSYNSSFPGTVCSDHMLRRQSDLMFVTYANPLFQQGPSIYLANVASSGDWKIELSSKAFNPTHVNSVFGQNMTLYSPSIFFRKVIAVYDELQFRCSSSHNAAKPTLCLFATEARESSSKWYKALAVDGEQVYERQCGVKPAALSGAQDSGSFDCRGLAVDTAGKYIMISKLAEFGSEVDYDRNFISDLGRKTGRFSLIILIIAFVVYFIIFVCVIRACHPRQSKPAATALA